MARTIRCALIAALAGTALGADAQSLTLSQMDWQLGPVSVANSDWGRASVSYTGTTDPLYFNLNVGGDWAIQNIPLVSGYGPGVQESINLSFDLGNLRGVDVSSVEMGWSVTSGLLAGAPNLTGFTSVGDVRYNYDYGIGNGADKEDDIPPPPKPKGDAVKRVARHSGALPNQEAKTGECVPAAVSNSLHYLNDKNHLNIPDNQISIEAIKGAVKFGIDQKYAPPGWADLKDAYCQSLNVGIVTTQLTLADEDIDKLFEEIRDRDCDAELDVYERGSGHVGAIQTITQLNNGNLEIDIAQDSDQGEAGGTGIDRVTRYPGDRKLYGPMFDRRFHGFVVECVTPEPPVLPVFGVCLSAFLVRRRRGHRPR